MGVDVSVIIVYYKTPELLQSCIASIYKTTTEISFEIVVVDNSSDEEMRISCSEDFPLVKWIDMGYNSGFARANNAGIKEANGDYVFLLNSDTELTDGSLAAMFEKYQELERKHRVGMLTCKVIGFDGKIQYNVNKYFPPQWKILEENPIYYKLFGNRITKQLRYDKEEYHTQKKFVAWVGMSNAFINAQLIKGKGFFMDEDFFMYHEDVEYCCRLNNAGCKQYYWDGVHILHVNGGSSSNSERRVNQIIISEWLCNYKRFGKSFSKLEFLLIKCNYSIQKFLSKESDPVTQSLHKKYELAKQYFPILFSEYIHATSKSKKPFYL